MRSSVLWPFMLLGESLVQGQVEPQVSRSVDEILRDLPREWDPILRSSLDKDAMLKQPFDGVQMTIPMDYYEQEQEIRYQHFWDSQASDLQRKAYDELAFASDAFNDSAATYQLAQINLLGLFGFPHNKSVAFAYMNEFNEMTNFSNASALFEVGVMHSTGFFGQLPVDDAQALLYYERAAALGDIRAKMALAYRSFYGISVPRDSDRAHFLYSSVAHEVRNHFNDTQWYVFPPYVESYNVRIPDFNGGLLGEKLNTMFTSAKRKRAVRPDITSSFLTALSNGNVVLRFGESRDSSNFEDDDEETDNQIVDAYYMAIDNYMGTYTQYRNVDIAAEILKSALEEYKDSTHFLDNLQRFYYGKCCALLGRIYLRGEGSAPTDIRLAREYLEKALDLAEEAGSVAIDAHTDLGIIEHYFTGNLEIAKTHYLEVTKHQGTKETETAEFQMAVLLGGGATDGAPATHERSGALMGQTKQGGRLTHLEIAALMGNTPAMYEYSSHQESGTGKKEYLDSILTFKNFLEKCEDKVAPHLREAFANLLRDKSEVALWQYALAAEQGFEAAQINAAYLLYQPPLQLEDPPHTPESRAMLAVKYYTNAFSQSNRDAGVVAGDILYRLGQYEQAVAAYRSAAKKRSAQGSWNLGYMYEYGLGVKEDYHLAKRYYEQVPNFILDRFHLGVKLTVWKLRAKSWWARFRNKDVDGLPSKVPNTTFFNFKALFSKQAEIESETSELSRTGLLQDLRSTLIVVLAVFRDTLLLLLRKCAALFIKVDTQPTAEPEHDE
ncbi:LAMI_0E15016g1_1 [Lachancea mirantina]|uniref:LAMI_0E15016g1_1 n=1 Tax=Lachancea mirantina TaxID=1230905 RepID=A0A1G4JSE5_9SACH|nr:LAMI_0E15016g1_1 [Lachancea mirantina]